MINQSITIWILKVLCICFSLIVTLQKFFVIDSLKFIYVYV